MEAFVLLYNEFVILRCFYANRETDFSPHKCINYRKASGRETSRDLNYVNLIVINNKHITLTWPQSMKRMNYLFERSKLAVDLAVVRIRPQDYKHNRKISFSTFIRVSACVTPCMRSRLRSKAVGENGVIPITILFLGFLTFGSKQL